MIDGIKRLIMTMIVEIKRMIKTMINGIKRTIMTRIVGINKLKISEVRKRLIMTTKSDIFLSQLETSAESNNEIRLDSLETKKDGGRKSELLNISLQSVV